VLAIDAMAVSAVWSPNRSPNSLPCSFSLPPFINVKGTADQLLHFLRKVTALLRQKY
jgi:hypothetical protein